MTFIEFLAIAVYAAVVRFAIRPAWNRYAGRSPLTISAPYWAAFIVALMVCALALILRNDGIAQNGAAYAFALFVIAVSADVFGRQTKTANGPHIHPDP